jgi:UDP-N-acetylmuramyl pentapeptide phosphotransferase/UDP-N-acetylglucosamine-1-phosphate transferase
MLLEKVLEIGLLTAGASFVLNAAIVGSQRWHGKISHDHDLGGVQKMHTVAVPRIGGIGVVAGLLGGVCGFRMLFPGQIHESQLSLILLLLVASLPAFIAGVIEDFTKKVSVRMRLAATVASSLLASALLGATLGDLNIWGLDSLLVYAPVAIVVTAVIVAGAANAVNIIDGFNGLSSSTIILMSAGLGAIAWQYDDAFVMTLAALSAGAAGGFFLLNYPAGKLFLGDGGAYFLGFWVAEMAVLLLVRHAEINAWQVLGVCAYPIIEVLFSIYRRRFIQNVSPGAPDALHLHTLVFRRVVFKHVRRNPARTWNRNAGVVWFISPVVALCIAGSVFLGGSVSSAIALVAIQLALYVAAYGRVVRGRWSVRARRPALIEVGEVDEVSTVS